VKAFCFRDLERHLIAAFGKRGASGLTAEAAVNGLQIKAGSGAEKAFRDAPDVSARPGDPSEAREAALQAPSKMPGGR
jgi:hypothetical protein